MTEQASFAPPPEAPLGETGPPQLNAEIEAGAREIIGARRYLATKDITSEYGREDARSRLPESSIIARPARA